MLLLRFFNWNVLLLALDTIVQPNTKRAYLTIHLGSHNPGVVVTLSEISLPSVMRMRMRSSARAEVVLRAGFAGYVSPA